MNLSKRALTIILPVILFGNVFIAVSVYWIERQSIEQAEIARVSRQMERLKSLFDRDLDFTRNLVFLMQTGDVVRSFVRETDENFRTTAIGAKVQDGIEFFSNASNRFVSFAILQSNQKIEYYFEKSEEPFASMHAVQLETAKQLMLGSELSSDEFVQDNDGPLLIHSELIDRTTFSKPLATQKQSALIVQSAVRPRDFLKMKAELEKEYGSAVVVAPRIDTETGTFTSVGSLLPDLKIALRLTKPYMAAQFRTLKVILAVGCLILSFGSIGILLFLIRRTVTGPIATLDRQVIDVLSGRRQSLDRMMDGGEIDRLSINIKTLHDRALDTLEKVQIASWTDVLTGISNRLHFSLIGNQMVDAARVSDKTLSLLFIDLDNFKFVNDTFGHAAGDAVLQQFTAILQAILGPHMQGNPLGVPVLARLSGDEFAVLVWEMEKDAIASTIASCIIDAFKEGLTVNAETYPVTASIGLACFPADAHSFTQLISCADQAMYHTKASGKNGIACYSREFAEIDERVEQIKIELQRLDPGQEFSLVYMPIVSRDGVVKKCEALLRWNSPSLGMVSPGEFIPIAETHALFSKIDKWVLEKAVGDLCALQEIFGNGIVLSINISTAELSSNTIIDYSIETTKRHGVSTSAIEIELTETFAAKVPVKAKRVVQGLRDAGFKISLDDFGSGYTSLKQILEFPLDTVKLDRELVMKIRDPRGMLALTSIIDLCHSQNCVVVAEGVEDMPTQAALSLAGCDLFQGFGICRPLSLSDLVTRYAADEENEAFRDIVLT